MKKLPPSLFTLYLPSFVSVPLSLSRSFDLDPSLIISVNRKLKWNGYKINFVDGNSTQIEISTKKPSSLLKI